jgi:hypothetical protein
MSGVVVVAGVFPPGSEVELFKIVGEHVLRPEGSESCGRRLVDENGNVGFDGVEVGSSYIMRGYVAGNYTIVRARGVDAAAPNSELAQPPIQPVTPVVGTQEAKDPPVPPAPPADAAELPVGVPDGVSTGVVEPEPADAPPKLYILLVPGTPIDATVWQPSPDRVPATLAADGSTIAPQPLWRYVGLGEPVPLGADWQEYAGPTEPLPVEPQPPEPPSAMLEVPTPQTAPVVSDAPAAQTPPPSAVPPAEPTPGGAQAPPASPETGADQVAPS